MPPTTGPSFVYYRLQLREECFEDVIDVTGVRGENIDIKDIQEAIREQNVRLQPEEREYYFDFRVYAAKSNDTASFSNEKQSLENSTAEVEQPPPLSCIEEWDALTMGGDTNKNLLVVEVDFLGPKAPPVVSSPAATGLHASLEAFVTQVFNPLLDVLREYRNALRENNQRLVVLTDEIEQLKAAVSAGTGQNTATAAAAIRPHDESDSLQNDSQSLTLQQ